jgi:hypothetical protein
MKVDTIDWSGPPSIRKRLFLNLDLSKGTWLFVENPDQTAPSIALWPWQRTFLIWSSQIPSKALGQFFARVYLKLFHIVQKVLRIK